MLVSSDLLLQRSDSAADPLSECLKRIEARCVITGGFTIGGAWALRFPAPGRLKIIAQIEGTCLLRTEDTEQPIQMEPGDLVVLDGGSSIQLDSGDDIPGQDATLVLPASSRSMTALAGTGVAQIGGHIDANRVGKAMLHEVLPPLTHLKAGSHAATTLRPLLDQLLTELSTPGAGSTFLAETLSQLIFVHALRQYLTGPDALPPGRLRVLTDETLAPAIRLMHEEPGRPWRLQDLARSAAMSRTAFATRFKHVAGRPPLTYLSDLRIELAEQALRTGTASVSELATASGYGSVSAFSTAFKRATGLSPRQARTHSTEKPAPATANHANTDPDTSSPTST
jgi:AraC-like DNA-binding protein